MNYVIRAADNSRMSTTVHVARMKPYTDLSLRPIHDPPDDLQDPYLMEHELPADNFKAGPTATTVDFTVSADPEPADGDSMNQTLSPGPQTASTSFADPDVLIAQKIVHQRLYKGKPQFEAKWKGFCKTTWEPLDNILDPSLLTKYYQAHPHPRNLVTASDQLPTEDPPVIAAFTMRTRCIPHKK